MINSAIQSAVQTQVKNNKVVPKLCQADVGEDSPEPCGKHMRKLNDWTWRCPEHGEMH